MDLCSRAVGLRPVVQSGCVNVRLVVPVGLAGIGPDHVEDAGDVLGGRGPAAAVDEWTGAEA